MVYEIDLYVVMHIVAMVLLGFVAIVAWNHRDKPAGVPLTVFSVAGAIWVFPEIVVELMDLSWRYWMQILVYICIDLVIVGWFYIAVEYSSRALKPVPPMLAAMLVVPGINQIVQWTNPLHGLFYVNLEALHPGPLFFVHLVFALLMIAGGIVLVLDEYRRVRGVYRRQAAAMSLTMSFFLLAIVVEVFELLPGGPSTIFLAGPLIGGVFLWVLYYADFLEVAPVARDTLIRNMDDGVIALDTAGRIIDVNPAAREILDVDTSVVGRSSSILLDRHPELAERVRGNLDETTEFSRTVDGEVKHYGLRVSRVYDDTTSLFGRTGDRQQIGWIAVIHDVTDAVTRSRELERKNRQLEQFARFVSHDLHSPLGIASTYLDFAEETGDPEDFEAARKRLDRMNAMLEDLLDLARMGAGSVEPERCQLSTVVTSAWEHVDTADATLELSDDLLLTADPEKLQHVLENLVRNAVEHGGERVTVEVGALSSHDGFYVEDDGPGIVDGMEAAVLDQGYTTKPDGTGLGLAIVMSIVDAHGWELTVAESEASGARFEIWTADTVIERVDGSTRMSGVD